MPDSDEESPLVDIGLRCEKCGYNLTGLTEPRCPECGHEVGYEEVLSVFEVRERRKALATLALLGFFTVCSVLVTWLVPLVEGGSMFALAGIIILPFSMASIVVHGLGIILGLAGLFSRPYRIWFMLLLVLVCVDAVVFVRKISG